MTPQEFCYWLQGYFELSGEGSKSINEYQVNQIRNHLNMVFVHSIDPQAGDKADFLDALHSAGVATTTSANVKPNLGHGPGMRC